MQSGSLLINNAFGLTPQQSVYCVGLYSQISAAQLSCLVIFPEKRYKVKASKHSDIKVNNNIFEKLKREDHRINPGDETSDLLGYEIYSGKLSIDQRKSNRSTDVQALTEGKNLEAIDAKLTSKFLLWGCHRIYLEDVTSVSHSVGLSDFTIHSFPIQDHFVPFCFIKPQRMRKDFHFLASNPDEALQWVSSFADQQCYVNCFAQPHVSLKKLTSDVCEENLSEPYIRSKTPPRMLIILNPRSGHGRSTEVFYGMVEPIFKLAGFNLEVVETTSAGQARRLAATVDLSTCPDGIVCVGGDGIVNEVINGLLSRINQKEASSIPIGIIPAGSDNSLVWTVLGVRDPVSAAMVIIKGGLTAVDVLSVKWKDSGAIHFGMTASYFGFVSDVLELSEKYQKRFGPLRYLVAGVLKFLGLPKYHYEVDYLPASMGNIEEGKAHIMTRSNNERVASSLSSIDSITSPSETSETDQDTTFSSRDTSSVPSQYFRGTDSSILEDNWKVAKGSFLGILVCNHPCKTVQSVSPQVVAPKAKADDGALDLLLVHGSGRLRLLIFYLWLQFGRHLTLPFVEYVKVKSVKIKRRQSTHAGCGIDGELFSVHGQVVSSLLPFQCKLIGRPPHP